MTPEYYTLIVASPMWRGVTRKLLVSRRLVRWAGTTALLTPLVLVVLAFSLGFRLAHPGRPRHPDLEGIATKLRTSTDEMQQRMREASAATEALLSATKAQEAELSVLQARYEQLRALNAGQERLAVTYGRILREATLRERIVDLAVGWLLGTISSITAAVLIGVWKRGKDEVGVPPEIQGS